MVQKHSEKAKSDIFSKETKKEETKKEETETEKGRRQLLEVTHMVVGAHAYRRTDNDRTKGRSFSGGSKNTNSVV